MGVQGIAVLKLCYYICTAGASREKYSCKERPKKSDFGLWFRYIYSHELIYIIEADCDLLLSSMK